MAIKLHAKPRIELNYTCDNIIIPCEHGQTSKLLAAIDTNADVGDDVEIEIAKPKKRRSLDANSYLWVLCGKLAEVISNPADVKTKTDIYRDAIREKGVYHQLEIEEEALHAFNHAWGSNGLGFFTEINYSWKDKGRDKIHITAYSGSHIYSTTQMSKLLEYVIAECKEQGIETLTPDELAKMEASWKPRLKEE